MASSKLTAAFCCALAIGVAPSVNADSWNDRSDKDRDRSYERYDYHWWSDSHWHDFDWSSHTYRRSSSFNRIATLPNYLNNADRASETVSEIVSASEDGMTIVYTDGTLEAVGFIDIKRPWAPEHSGTVDVGGEPTSVAVLGYTYALVGVNTSASFTSPAGHLAVIDMETRQIVAEIDLGGQPDSLAISRDRRFAAVVIENERDEDIVVEGVGGGLPQAPAGYLAIVDLHGQPGEWTVRTADLTGLAAYGTADPEPEFVDINRKNQAVVTLQENNHVAIVDLESAAVVSHFDAGTVDLTDIDVTEEDVISLDGSLDDVPREPDAVAWVPFGRHRSLIATANEGDLFGGSRGFTLFEEDGTVVYDSGNEYEHLAVRIGHYPEGRSENKGSEPESIEYGRFDGNDYLFVGSERGSFVAVYKLNYFGMPEFQQVLPGPLGPEGLLAIPERNLLIVSGEEDDPEFGVRSAVMIYRLSDGRASYPQIQSANDAQGKPIPWSALSGMVEKPGRRHELLAVWDSFYAQSAILTIDVSKSPAVITESLAIDGGTGNFDPEGIDVAPDGTYWIASEGNASGSRPNRLLQVDAHGSVIAEVGLPAQIEACRAASANTGSLGAGFEGVAVLNRSSWSWRKRDEDYVLLIAQQRGWDYTTPECEDLDDDWLGLRADGEPMATRIWIYDPKNGTWDHIAYELADEPENAAWVGLSEITKVPGGYVILERDNRTGDFAALKTLVNFSGYAAKDGLIEASEKRVYDMLPDLLETNGWITDKPEGVAVTRDGSVFVVTDNDGVDDWSGETWFLRLGNFWNLFW